MRVFAFQVFQFRPWKRTYATGCVAAAIRGSTFVARVAGESTETYERPCRSRNESVSACSSSVIHERWRNSTSGTSGSRRAASGSSSASASGDFLKRGGYCISTPRSFPAAWSGSSASRNSRNAVSTSASSCPVIAFDAFAWKTKPSGVRSAQRAEVSGEGKR